MREGGREGGREGREAETKGGREDTNKHLISSPYLFIVAHWNVMSDNMTCVNTVKR